MHRLPNGSGESHMLDGMGAWPTGAVAKPATTRRRKRFLNHPGVPLRVGAARVRSIAWPIPASLVAGAFFTVVVVHRMDSFQFVIDPLDHEPAHIQITGVELAKINLLGPDGAPALLTGPYH